MAFEEFDALDRPSVVGHLKVPNYEPSPPAPHRPHSCQSVPNAGSRRLAVVADRKQPVLDGEANTFLDQGFGNARYACPVGTLPDQLFEISDGREGQRDWNAVGFGFFCGHGKKLAFNRCTEKYLFRLCLGPKEGRIVSLG